VFGRDPGTDPERRQCGGELVVVEGVELLSGQGHTADADVGGDRGGGVGMVAGDHHHADAGASGQTDGIRDAGPWRVDDPDQQLKGEIGERGRGVLDGGRVVVQTAGGDPERAEALTGELADAAVQPGASSSIEGSDALGCGERRAALEQDVGRALDGHQGPRGLVGVDRGHELGGRVERDLRQALAAADGVEVQASLGGEDEQGRLGGVAGDRALAVDVGVVAQHGSLERGRRPQRRVDGARRLVAVPGNRVAVTVEDHGTDGHLVAGQRARLVGADDLRRPEGLDRGEPLDDRPVTGHGRGPQRQGDRDDRREALGDGGDGQRDRVQCGLGRRVPPQERDGEHGGHREAGDGRQPAREHVDLPLQRGRPLGRLGEKRGDLADPGRHPGRGDDHLAAASDDGGVHPHHPHPLRDRRVHLADDLGVLVHGRGLTGQRRLVHGEDRVEQHPSVGRDPIASLDQDDVAGNQLVRLDVGRAAVTADGRDPGEQLLQRPDAAVCPRLLDRAEHRVEQQHATDDGRVLELADNR
jgi:hypothetical protein